MRKSVFWRTVAEYVAVQDRFTAGLWGRQAGPLVVVVVVCCALYTAL